MAVEKIILKLFFTTSMSDFTPFFQWLAFFV